jgi:hypothetical protein
VLPLLLLPLLLLLICRRIELHGLGRCRRRRLLPLVPRLGGIVATR